MRYLSIYENFYEALEFLKANDFLSDFDLQLIEEGHEDQVELLSVFEGDPDFLDVLKPNGLGKPYFNRVYFAEYNPTWKHEEDSVVFTTAEDSEETELIRSFVEPSGKWESFISVYDEESWELYEAEMRTKIAYRAGSGYIYKLYRLKEEAEDES